MILAVLFANVEGNILIERFHGVPAEERLHWRSFLVKLGADNLKGAKNEELLVACHKSVYIVYTVLGDVSIYVVGKDEYDELACMYPVNCILCLMMICSHVLKLKHWLGGPRFITFCSFEMIKEIFGESGGRDLPLFCLVIDTGNQYTKIF
ncbi:uncharacterized protein LOC130940486 isoform X1 [Arachis stenosperma]|uniref:uncharacterized protein LOC130940486 isoform X1 n=1 Tax=Arachis stenosperma TaxID=217475 RepID=UPI0025AB9938|nr:uncharacterized protein LOC130940486 isoform X1 [Arachis stenosperma]